jgi:hypothetical protein
MNELGRTLSDGQSTLATIAGGRWLWKNAIARGGWENISLKNASFGKPAGIRFSSRFSTVQDTLSQLISARNRQ